MIRWLLRLLLGCHDCEKDGHDYVARYDDVIDPRLTGKQIKDMADSAYRKEKLHCVRARMYIRDICRFCGDTVDRIEGLNAMEVLAHQAKRIA